MTRSWILDPASGDAISLVFRAQYELQREMQHESINYGSGSSLNRHDTYWVLSAANAKLSRVLEHLVWGGFLEVPTT